ncbi:MAG: inositol monophosphatase [Planctomycetes bacterium]|nr:inositol monophosphatase [Planctomycetota bacterium]
MTDINRYLGFARETALRAGSLLTGMASNFGKIHYKTNSGNLVTAADKASEALIIKAIRKEYPHHCIMAEESGACNGTDKEFEWLVDPLDGTTNYAHQLPLWSVSIALAHNKKVIAGVVYHVSLKELYYAAKCKGAYCNGKRIHISKTPALKKSLLVTGIPYSTREDPHDNFVNFKKFSLIGQAVRRLGSAAIDMSYLACGRFDGYWERDLQPWDVAAGSIIITEAGGKLTRFNGTPYQVYSPSETLASNGLIHKEMMSVLKH